MADSQIFYLYLFRLKICDFKKYIFLNFLQRFRRCDLQGVSIGSVLMNPPRAALPRPDLLEFAIGSDACIVVKYEI